MKLIKNISDDKDVKIERKLREILRAINIERKFSKEEIFSILRTMLKQRDC